MPLVSFIVITLEVVVFTASILEEAKIKVMVELKSLEEEVMFAMV